MAKAQINEMTSREIFDAVDQALMKVYTDYAAGTLDMSGRFYTDEELAQMRETGTWFVSKTKKSGTAA